MKFRLTYAGPLMSSGNDNKDRKGPHKHDLRMAFHPQLKRLWETVPFLKAGRSSYNGSTWAPVDTIPEPKYDPKLRAAKFKVGSWNFVPLITEDMEFYCSLEILFLRVGSRKALLNQGDLDGRLKTLLDALSMPTLTQDYTFALTPGSNPLNVLLENDRQVTKISIETDVLLESTHAQSPSKYEAHDVRLIIAINISPVEPANWSMPFL